jgi:hypothetical protein
MGLEADAVIGVIELAVVEGDLQVDTCEAVIASAAALAKQFGQDLADQPINSVELDGDEATLRVGDGDEREVVTMERDGDDWLVADTVEDKASDRAQIDKWLASWCSVAVGMTKAEAAKVRGGPTGEFDETEATPQVECRRCASSIISTSVISALSRPREWDSMIRCVAAVNDFGMRWPAFIRRIVALPTAHYRRTSGHLSFARSVAPRSV